MRRRHLGRIVLGGLAASGAIDAPAQEAKVARGEPGALTFRYRDDDGPGLLSLVERRRDRDADRPGDDPAVPIEVSLEQDGRRFVGSGVRVPLGPGRPAREVYAFAVATPDATYFFQGTTTSGITLSGRGTYHKLGTPERAYAWSIVMGG